MKTKLFLSIAFIVTAATSGVCAGAASQAEGSGSNRGTFLSRSGYIIPAEQVIIDHYIAQYDYNYPLPAEDDLTVTTASGVKGDNVYVQIGLKGKKIDFAEAPPLNLSFCVDRSGSMTGVMPWVKDSFYIFIDKVREGDIISLVDMNNTAQTLIAPMKIQSQADRTRFKREVDRIRADGSTNVYAGLAQSYREVEKNANPGYVNRVIILTDGMHNSGEMIGRDILNMAGVRRKEGINVSVVLLGIEAATGLMTDIAIEGGGSSRFVSDHDEMVKIFQTELDRMIIPAARELQMRLVLADGVSLKNTWGYRNYREDNTVHYYVSTLHNGDYETLFAELDAGRLRADTRIASFYADYIDLAGNEKTLGPYHIDVRPSDAALIANERVREAEGLLTLARGLIDIANKTSKIAGLERELYQYADPSPQRADVVQQILLECSQNIEIAGRVKNYLSAVNESLDGTKYEKEIEILDNYVRTFTNVFGQYEAKENEAESSAAL